MLLETQKIAELKLAIAAAVLLVGHSEPDGSNTQRNHK